MANLLRSALLFCATLYVVVAKHEVYEGHSLYEVSVQNAEQAWYVNGLENQILIDIFMYVSPDRPGHILVPKDVKADFEAKLTAAGADYKIEVPNMREQLLLEDQLLSVAAARSNVSSKANPGLNFDEIHRFRVVDDYLTRLGEEHPDTVTVASAGKSFEGRDVKYLKISTTNFEDRSKPIVFVMSLLHAREWVTLPPALFAIERLVLDVQERDLLETIDWIILPIANPDGYEFTHTTSRFWRKNRATGFMPNDLCMGVDLNRNFGHLWGLGGSSENVCAETFRGYGPFSEPETQNIRKLLEEHRGRVELFIDLHSFGSMILYGFGDGQLPTNALTLHVNAVSQAQAIDRVKWPSKRDYIVGNIFHVLYAASGVSTDYVQNSGVPFAYTYELPSWRGVTGSLNGFLVEAEFIRQAGEETWEGIKTAARFVRDL